jgi:soluble lytic murein transglycosylase
VSTRVATRRRAPRRLVTLVAWLLVIGAVATTWALVHQSMPGWYARLWYPLEHEETIREEAARNDLPPELVAAVIHAESGFIPDSRSSEGAVGLMQVLPSTAEWVAGHPGRPSPGPSDLEDPETNIAYGAYVLGHMRREFGSVPAALAAYNAGDANLRGWQARARARGEAFRIPEDVPFPETRAYVVKVMDLMAVYRRAYGEELSAS